MEIGEGHSRGLLLGANATRQSVLGPFGMGYKESETEVDSQIVLVKDANGVRSNLADRRD
jgi:hypothetical protein